MSYNENDFTVGELRAIIADLPDSTPIVMENPVGRGQSYNIRNWIYISSAIMIDGKTYAERSATDMVERKPSLTLVPVKALLILEG